MRAAGRHPGESPDRDGRERRSAPGAGARPARRGCSCLLPQGAGASAVTAPGFPRRVPGRRHRARAFRPFASPQLASTMEASGDAVHPPLGSRRVDEGRGRPRSGRVAGPGDPLSAGERLSPIPRMQLGVRYVFRASRSRRFSGEIAPEGPRIRMPGPETLERDVPVTEPEPVLGAVDMPDDDRRPPTGRRRAGAPAWSVTCPARPAGTDAVPGARWAAVPGATPARSCAGRRLGGRGQPPALADRPPRGQLRRRPHRRRGDPPEPADLLTADGTAPVRGSPAHRGASRPIPGPPVPHRSRSATPSSAAGSTWTSRTAGAPLRAPSVPGPGR